MMKFALVSLAAVLAAACSTMEQSMPHSGGMMSDKMATPAMDAAKDKTMSDSKMMDGMEKKKETPMMSGDKM